MKFLKSGITLLAAISLLTACKDDENGTIIDTTPPSISNVEHDMTVEPGQEFNLEFVLEDDIALGEARIDIHDDFDAHEHEGGRIMATPFEYTTILDEMRGKTRHVVHLHIPIPADAATGPYHLQINYTDNAGNEGELFISAFEISDPALSPSITITNFGAEEELELNEEGILYLEGSIEDPDGLDEVHIMVSEEHEDHSNGRMKEEVILYDQEWELGGATTFNLQDIDPAIDLSGAEAGHYELRIMARDTQGHVKVVRREIHVD